MEQFFSSLGSGNNDQAMAMMDKDVLGSAGTQEMWKKSFNTLDSLNISRLQVSPAYTRQYMQPLLNNWDKSLNFIYL